MFIVISYANFSEVQKRWVTFVKAGSTEAGITAEVFCTSNNNTGNDMKKRYAYRPHSPAMLARMVIVWSVATFLTYVAMNWKGGMDTGLFVLSPALASALLWLLVAAMLPGAILFVFMLVKGDLTPCQVALGQTSVSDPRDRRNLPDVELGYQAATKVEMVAICGNRYIEVRSRGGRMSFSEVCLPGNSAFESLFDNLFKRVGSGPELHSR